MLKRYFLKFLLLIIFSFFFSQDLSAQKRITCDLCYRSIEGKYFKFETDHEESHVCISCKTIKPTCTICRVPHNRHDLTLYRGRELWCDDCVDNTSNCELCENPIAGKYFTLNFSEGKWCQSCMRDFPQCHFCQEPHDKVGLILEEGKSSCTQCAEHSVVGSYAYDQLAAKIHPQIESMLGKEFEIITIRAVTPSQMSAYMQGFINEAEGLASKEGYLDPIHAPAISNDTVPNLGVFTRSGNKREILVINGLPEELAWEVLSHEMTHAWQDEHHPNVRDFYLVEGFAQLVAQKICYSNYQRQRLNLLYYRGDDYGHAYRVLQTLEDREGFDAVMDSVRRGSLPEDYQTTPPKEIYRAVY